VARAWRGSHQPAGPGSWLRLPAKRVADSGQSRGLRAAREATWRCLLSRRFREVDLRGLEPLTPCMPSMRRGFTTPCSTSRFRTTAQVRSAAERSVVVRGEVACGVVSGKFLARPCQPWWRPPNCQSWISTLAYSPARTSGAPASIASTAARSPNCTSSTLPTHPAPSPASNGPHKMTPPRWPGPPNQRRCAAPAPGGPPPRPACPGR
jgi:hypothetical protein